MTIDTVANALLTSLTTGTDFSLPTIDLASTLLQVPAGLSDEMYEVVDGPEIADLTTRTVGGAGVFDALMASNKAHLQAEFDKGRITGADYTKAYIELTQMSLQSAVQFALGKDQAFWQAQQAQIAALSGRVQLEMNKVALAKAKIEAETAQVAYAEAKIQLATVSVQYDTASYNLANLLPAQLAQSTAQTSLIGSQKIGQDDQNAILAYQLSTVLPGQVALTTAQMVGQTDQNAILVYQLATILPGQVALTSSQKIGQDDQNAILAYQLSTVLPAQVALSGSQKILVDGQGATQAETREAARAQTMDTRTDGTTPIAGVLGGQKSLYAQQVISYQRDAEVKAGKLFTDAWTVQKTVDEGLTAPDGFTNTSLDTVLSVIKTNNGFV